MNGTDSNQCQICLLRVFLGAYQGQSTSVNTRKIDCILKSSFYIFSIEFLEFS